MGTNARQDLNFSAFAALDVDTDAVFDALAAERRRYVIACLLTYTTPMSMADLATELAMWERDAGADDVPAAAEDAYAVLSHVDIPKLADAGIVEYDEDGNAVALADAAPEIADHLSLPRIES